MLKSKGKKEEQKDPGALSLTSMDFGGSMQSNPEAQDVPGLNYAYSLSY
jgi:hypothetical protein